MLSSAKDAGEILNIMVNNLLDASKIEAGKFELDPEKTEYRKQLWKIIQTNKAKAVQKGIELKFKNDPKIPKHLMLDITRYTQVLMNLISNAIKFTD